MDCLPLSSEELHRVAESNAQSALRIYTQLREKGAKPSVTTIVGALRCCASSGDLQTGAAIHAYVSSISSSSSSSSKWIDTYVGNTLVHLYCKCGCMPRAREVFDQLQSCNKLSVVSWNCLINGYAKNGEAASALDLYVRMQIKGHCEETPITVLAALAACSSLADIEEAKLVEGKLLKEASLEKGRAIHSKASRSGHDSNAFVANSLVVMYAKCGSTQDAHGVFEKMQDPSVVSWNCLLMGYADTGEGQIALDLYELMGKTCVPDDVTFLAVLKSCSILADQQGNLRKQVYLNKGRTIHAQVVQAGYELDTFVASSLVDMYAKCGSMDEALDIFLRMPNRNIVSWTSVVMGYAQGGNAGRALYFYAQLQAEGLFPNSFTFVCALKACGCMAEAEEGVLVGGQRIKVHSLKFVREIHEQALGRGYRCSVFLISTLLDVYAKCGSMADAFHVFETAPCKNVIMWSNIIMGYAVNGEGRAALQLYAQMRDEGCSQNAVTYVAALKACSSLSENRAECLEMGRTINLHAASSGHELDPLVANSLVDMYAKCGSMKEARIVFDRMPQVRCDSVLWTCLIMGYADCGEALEALHMYRIMQNEVWYQADVPTFLAALKASSSLADLESGRSIHWDVSNEGLDSKLVVMNSLIDFYGKCGRMPEAQETFDSCTVKSRVSWGALMTGYSRSGNTKRVLDLFESFRRECFEQPSAQVFLAVLSACSHAGLVEEGKRYFRLMSDDYGIVPDSEHRACMVDLLARANQVEEAAAVATLSSSSGSSAGATTWMALLSSSSRWKNVGMSKLAFARLLDVQLEQGDPRRASSYVLMSNVCRDLDAG